MTKQFKVGEIPDELKNVFMSAGIRKKDLKDVDFAFNIYKIIIMGISGENKTTTKQIEYIPHVFDPPDEDGKIEGGNEVHPMAHKKKSDNKPKEVKKKEEKKPPKKIVPKPIVIPETKPLPLNPKYHNDKPLYLLIIIQPLLLINLNPPQFLNLSPSLFLSHLPHQCLLN